MRWIYLALLAVFVTGCMNLGRVNPSFFPKEGKQYEVKCGKNYDLCVERAEYHCGFRGYKVKRKTKTKEGYTIVLECNR